MAVQFNTFAALLLAFPFYLAQKGKLAQYVNLAKPGANSTSVQGTGAAATNSGAGASNNAAASGNSYNPITGYSGPFNNGNDYLSELSGLGTVLNDAAKFFA